MYEVMLICGSRFPKVQAFNLPMLIVELNEARQA